MELNPVQLMVAGIIAGIVAAPVAQLIKVQLRWEGDKALYLALVASLIAGVVAALVAGVPLPQLSNDPLVFAASVGTFLTVTFAFATFIYKAILEKLQSGPLANIASP